MNPKRRNEIRSRDGIDPGNETEGFNASAGNQRDLLAVTLAERERKRPEKQTNHISVRIP